MSGWPWLTLRVREEAWDSLNHYFLGSETQKTMTAFPARASSLAFFANQRAAGAQFWLLSTMAHVERCNFACDIRYCQLSSRRQLQVLWSFVSFAAALIPKGKKVLRRHTLVFLSSCTCRLDPLMSGESCGF